MTTTYFWVIGERDVRSSEKLGFASGAMVWQDRDYPINEVKECKKNRIPIFISTEKSPTDDILLGRVVFTEVYGRV